MSGMASPQKILDLDSQLGFDLTPAPTKTVRLLGAEWTIVCDINSFAVSDIMSGDSGGIARFIRGIIVPEESVAFAEALSKVPNLDGEKLGKLLEALIDAASTPVPPPPVRRTPISPKPPRKTAAR